MEDLIFYEMTCTTENCPAFNIQIRGLGPRETAFACGRCMKEITKWSISEDQLTKDGCIAFCDKSAEHANWTECYNYHLNLA